MSAVHQCLSTLMADILAHYYCLRCCTTLHSILNFQITTSKIHWCPCKADLLHTNMILGKNLKKLKMRKIWILWYKCQITSELKLSLLHIVKFNFGMILFSWIFSFWTYFVRKKQICDFCINLAWKIGKNQRKKLF